MKKNNIKIIFIILAAILFTVNYHNGNTEAKSKNLKWYSFNEGIKKAKASKKTIIIDFYADWCGWCKKMDVDLFQNDEIVKYLNKNYIPIRVDVESQNTIFYNKKKYSPKDLSNYFGISGLPTLIFLNHEAEMITKFPGYIQPENFKPLIEYISKKLYKTKLTLKDYIESKK